MTTTAEETLHNVERCPCTPEGLEPVLSERAEGRNKFVVACPNRALYGHSRISEPVYANTRSRAISSWNCQFRVTQNDRLAALKDDGPKCKRCGLRLPCNNCLPDISHFATLRRPSPWAGPDKDDDPRGGDRRSKSYRRSREAAIAGRV